MWRLNDGPHNKEMQLTSGGLERASRGFINAPLAAERIVRLTRGYEGDDWQT